MPQEKKHQDPETACFQKHSALAMGMLGIF